MNGQTKKSSMRNTAKNKFRRIAKYMVTLEAALLRVEEELEVTDSGSDHHIYLVEKKGGIERHMKGLKESLDVWTRQK